MNAMIAALWFVGSAGWAALAVRSFIADDDVSGLSKSTLRFLLAAMSLAIGLLALASSA